VTRIKEKKNKRIREKRKALNRSSMFLISGTLLVLTIAITVSCLGLKPKIANQARIKAELQAQIEDEEQRTKNIGELEQYVGSDAYVEDTARDKLGLVHENEIIFKAK